jgi:Ca-activated chloride channel family protein
VYARVSFASPLFLLALLLVPALVAFAIVMDRRAARYPVAYTNLELLSGLVAGRRRRVRRLLPLALLCLSLALAAAALAHPQASLSSPAQNATVVLLVDVSGSMRANDVAPTRLAAAIAAMNTFIDRLPPEFKVGLIAFSNSAQPLVTPTLDRGILRQGVSFLSPEAGTALGDGVAAAVKMVQKSLAVGGYVRGAPGSTVPGAIVLLSDGAQNRGVLQPIQAAEEAKKAGVRVYPVSLGTPNGSVTFGYGAFTNRVPVPPDPATMALIAQTTGGRSYTAQTASSVVDIYRTLGSSIERTTKEVQISSWFAAAAAFCLLGALAAGRVFDSRLP